jgi:hypothetical protein
MRSALAVILGLSLGVQHLAAQQPLSGNQRVRISSTRYQLDRQVGRVLSATTDSVTVQVDWIKTQNYRQVRATDTLALALQAVDRLEVSRHSGRRTGRGTLLGLGIGSGTGLVVGMATWKECHPEPNGLLTGLDCMMHPGSPMEQGLLGAVVFGFFGAGIGAIAGSMTHGDTWEEVPSRSALWLQPLPDRRLGVGLALSF